MSDNHYVPNPNNAHIDTEAFEEELDKRVREGIGVGEVDTISAFRDTKRNSIYGIIYDCALSYSNGMPEQLSDDALVCRFLSPEKFLWLIDQKCIPFSSPRRFDDDRDCAIHEDLNAAILQKLTGHLKENLCEADHDTNCVEWASFERSRRDDWLISCWNNLSEHKDDKLIWFKYTNGPIGAAITARYGKLRDALIDRVSNYDRDGKVTFGSVNYDPRINKLPPFNKRRGFSGEKEVRFVLRDSQFRRFVVADLSDVFFELFNLRYSEDAPRHHKSALEKMWIEAGGDPDGINEG